MKQLFLGLVLLSLSACKKDNLDANGLPKATQDGNNTAGFLLDGQPWLPAKNPSTPGTLPVGANWSSRLYQGGRALQLSFARYGANNEITAFNVLFSDVRKAGTFALDQDINPVVISDPRPPFAVYNIYSPTPKRTFYTGAQARGQAIITRFDTVARVVSGTFEAKVLEDGGTATHDITQGRFDIKF